LASENFRIFVLREIASYVSCKSALVSEQQLNITTVAVGDRIILEWSRPNLAGKRYELDLVGFLPGIYVDDDTNVA
jgi:hypothetical protein